ncbi:MAG: peptidyl-prolyl cis-trans isomerase [Planctomycetales bacterium]|nr:peptidyl-prolyl cis-trans isomerase [Planctomycetales bacterium]
MLVLKTSLGDITIELFEKEAPLSTKNFIEYAESGHYDGTIFHRIIDGFMIQGGGFSADMRQKKTNAPIKNESSNGLENKKYTLAMARTSAPDSATSQFFINTVDNDFLDRKKARDGVGYAVFGKVVDGIEVVDKMSRVKTTTKSGMQDVPVETISIEKVERVKDK